MEPQHQTLALFSAMNLANKNKQLGSALGFANALIERGTNAKFKENVSTPMSYQSSVFAGH
jgi:coatomer protein complex subunit alpha (xenin)